MPSCSALACGPCDCLATDSIVHALERDRPVKPDMGNPSVRFEEGGGGRKLPPRYSTSNVLAFVEGCRDFQAAIEDFP
jgi:hypothetical protein